MWVCGAAVRCISLELLIPQRACMALSLARCAIALAVLLGSYYPSPAGFASGVGVSPTVPAAQAVAFARPAPCTPPRRNRRRLAFEPCSLADRRRSTMAHVSNSAGAGGAGIGEQPLQQDSGDPSKVAAIGGLERDSMYMRRALELAAKGVGCTRPNPAVGCVILDKSGEIVGEGYHPRAGEPHAEVWAIRDAGERARGGTAYVTLEPCNHFGRTPPCTAALIRAGVARVVAGMVDPDPRTAGSGLRRLADAGLDVTVGVEGTACQAINAPFVHRILEKSCYGVLHCGVDASESARLEDTQNEPHFLVPPESPCYMEYDAVVVEGRGGVAKIEACSRSLPQTTLRVVVVRAPGGLEEELAAVADSELWAEDPRGTIIIAAVPEAADSGEKQPAEKGTVRASLAARRITIVDFPVPPSPRQHSPLAGAAVPAASESELEAETCRLAVKAVSKELHNRGLLSAAWDVGPALAGTALSEGCIQRALVRCRRRSVGAESAADNARGPISASEATLCEAGVAEKDSHAGLAGSAPGEEEGGEEVGVIVTALRQLSGRDGVRVRGDVGVAGRFGAVAGGGFVDIIVPTASKT